MRAHPKAAELLRKAISSIYIPKSPQQLAQHLAANIIYRNPGDVLVVDKPYGVGCLGYKQQGGGIFKDSRHDRRLGSGEVGVEQPNRSAAPENVGFFKDGPHSLHLQGEASSVTVDQSLPYLAEMVNQPGLHFCMGLKRYVSGPVVLPCQPRSYARIKASLEHVTLMTSSKLDIDPSKQGPHWDQLRKTDYLYRALAICIGRPSRDEETISGYATFQDSRDAKEYIFVPNARLGHRARTGKYAAHGEVYYRVLATAFGCSLIDLHFTRFTRHMPRLVLSHLGSPILGDSIYEQRLIDVDGEPMVVQPKDRWRAGTKQYEPQGLVERAGIERYTDLKKAGLPLFLAVYQSTFPMFGPTKSTRDAQLIARTPPPAHFHAMAELLGFYQPMRALLRTLGQDEDMELEGAGEEEMVKR